MKLSKKINDALNDQFNEEIASSYIYSSMAADLFHKNLSGFALWMTKQAAEEQAHAEKIHRYLDQMGERVYYKALAAPQVTWDSVLDLMKAALAHEEFITGKVYSLMKQAREEGDLATESFVRWYVDEQVEEEANVESVIQKLENFGNEKVGLYQLNKDMAARQ